MDKPEGPTSHDVVAAARRAFHTRRVGHGGTLDPFASGLLPLLLGRGTRLMPYLVGLRKTYEGTLRLGARTTTDDPTGEPVDADERWREVTDDRLAAAMAALTGRLAQRPPAYSAKKVRGTPAHRRIRRGEEVALASREVEVLRFAATGRDGPDVRFEAEVGGGTYVRALARDLGDALGCGAHLRALRRTRVGSWDVREAVPLAALAPGAPAPAPLAAAVPHLPRRVLNADEVRAVRHGRPVAADWEGEGPVALLHDRELVAVATRDGDVLRPRVVLDA